MKPWYVFLCITCGMHLFFTSAYAAEEVKRLNRPLESFSLKNPLYKSPHQFEATYSSEQNEDEIKEQQKQAIEKEEEKFDLFQNAFKTASLALSASALDTVFFSISMAFKSQLIMLKETLRTNAAQTILRKTLLAQDIESDESSQRAKEKNANSLVVNKPKVAWDIADLFQVEDTQKLQELKKKGLKRQPLTPSSEIKTNPPNGESKSTR